MDNFDSNWNFASPPIIPFISREYWGILWKNNFYNTIIWLIGISIVHFESLFIKVWQVKEFIHIQKIKIRSQDQKSNVISSSFSKSKLIFKTNINLTESSSLGIIK